MSTAKIAKSRRSRRSWKYSPEPLVNIGCYEPPP